MMCPICRVSVPIGPSRNLAGLFNAAVIRELIFPAYVPPEYNSNCEMSRGMLIITAVLATVSKLTTSNVSVSACSRSCPESTPVNRNVTLFDGGPLADGAALGAAVAAAEVTPGGRLSGEVVADEAAATGGELDRVDASKIADPAW